MSQLSYSTPSQARKLDKKGTRQLQMPLPKKQSAPQISAARRQTEAVRPDKAKEARKTIAAVYGSPKHSPKPLRKHGSQDSPLSATGEKARGSKSKPTKKAPQRKDSGTQYETADLLAEEETLEVLRGFKQVFDTHKQAHELKPDILIEDASEMPSEDEYEDDT
ncbi:unnamed protein product [Vitrella brassicaformis CCMP3155]|uniref:Uncharacterized protein n=2 Tax=Vitrella brassicaformis TaxID=1169539 RepID=A0A0G4EUM5_VITBC|nr:unnamed protein product [Vitrella brassicaformis CCMP3155]|eukprot:CEM02144.1 unnamed protein product [Vitrella brassicaformis CCMP3155]